jgi:hypothetical protein
MSHQGNHVVFQGPLDGAQRGIAPWLGCPLMSVPAGFLQNCPFNQSQRNMEMDHKPISKSRKSWMVHENWDSSSWIMKDYDNSWHLFVSSFRLCMPDVCPSLERIEEQHVSVVFSCSRLMNDSSTLGIRCSFH